VKSTANRGYPYPECNPPLVKDAADLPAQLKALATAVDADLSAVQTAATASLNPPGVDLQRTTAQVLIPGQLVNVDTTRFATGGVAIDLVAGAFTVPTGGGGLWLLTAAVSAASGPTVFHNLSIRVNGIVARTSSLNPNAVGGDPIDNAAHVYVILQAGDTVSMTQNFTGAASISYSFAHLSGVLVARQS
jgi:hypothetical protein